MAGRKTRNNAWIQNGIRRVGRLRAEETDTDLTKRHSTEKHKTHADKPHKKRGGR